MRHAARIGWVAVAALVTGILATALGVERVLGEAAAPSLVFDVDVSHDALAELPAVEIERAWRERLRDFDVQTSARPATRSDAVTVRVTVVGAVEGDAEEIVSALRSGARLAIVLVRDGDEAMARWYRAVKQGELPAIDQIVEAEPDAWYADLTGIQFTDTYLKAPSRPALERAVALLAEQHPLPTGHHIAYERVSPDGHDRGSEPYYRTYLVGEDVILSNEHIAGADVTYDPNTLRPEVLAEMTRDGARRFGDATGASIGRKLAILIDGDVVSAPVVQGAIRGGRVSITMGGGDPRTMERDAAALASALGSSSGLPAGIEPRLVATNAKPMGLAWALRVLVAALGGVLALVVIVQTERRGWFTRAPSISPGAERWDRLAIPALVTCFVPALLWYVAQDVVLPGVNEVELYNVMQGDVSIAARAQLGVLALGVMPVVSAFILVELFAILVEALVPARRGRRLGTPVDRRRLDRAAWILVGVLALVQAYFMAAYLTTLNASGYEVWFGAKGMKWVVVATLAAGVMVQVIGAELISRHGLCNGYLVLLASNAVIDLIALLAPDADPRVLDPQRPSAILFGAIAATAAFATLISTRARSGADGPRLPYTGVVPASLVRGGLGLFALAALWSDAIAERLHALQPWTPVIELAATAPLTLLILVSWRRPWTTPGIVATFAFLATLVLLPFSLPEPYRLAAPFAEGVLLGAVAAELWVGALARVRLPDAVSVLVVHDVDRADAAADRLAAAGIPHALLGVRNRAATRFITAFAPIAVRVPAARADEAAALLATPAPAPPPS